MEKDLILDHALRYPQAQVQDFLKLLFQQEFGCGHLITDNGKSLEMLGRELSQLHDPAAVPLIEPIGNGLCRLYLQALFQTGLSIKTFQRFFCLTANQPQGTVDGFLKKAQIFKRICEDGHIGLDLEDIDLFLTQWEASGYGPFRHSESYRESYHPAYRVVHEDFCEFLPLFAKIDGLLEENNSVTVSIDGDSAAGKTTLAARLKDVYDCNVIHMDHFFLQPAQRTPERLQEIGGNLDYERFLADVVSPLKEGREVVYQPFNCQHGALEAPIHLKTNPLTIIEGVYSQHPRFGPSDLNVFLSLPKAEQLSRIKSRNGEKMLKRFINEWIPMEKAYFQKFSIPQYADFVVKRK